MIIGVRLAALAWLFFALPGVVRSQPVRGTTHSSAQLYGAVIAHLAPADSAPAVAGRPLSGWIVTDSAISASLRAAFAQLHADAFPFTTADFARHVVVLTPVEVARLERAWGGVPRLVHLTAVAYSPDAHEALVGFDIRCGGLCGRTGVLWLREGAAGWAVHRELVSVVR